MMTGLSSTAIRSALTEVSSIPAIPEQVRKCRYICSPSVQKIAFAVTIYEAFERHLHFGMVQNLDASIINADTSRELAHFALTDCSQSVTAMVVGELYRYKGAWKFSAVGSGVYRDLAGFCGMYGIETG